MDDYFLLEKYHDLLEDGAIPSDLYDKYDVKRGLRNNNGTGVLVGLTKVAEVSGYYVEDGVKLPKEGNLYYRGIDIRDVAKMVLAMRIHASYYYLVITQIKQNQKSLRQ